MISRILLNALLLAITPANVDKFKAALLHALQTLADKTKTDIDDQILDAVQRYLDDTKPNDQ